MLKYSKKKVLVILFHEILFPFKSFHIIRKCGMLTFFFLISAEILLWSYRVSFQDSLEQLTGAVFLCISAYCALVFRANKSPPLVFRPWNSCRLIFCLHFGFNNFSSGWSSLQDCLCLTPFAWNKIRNMRNNF